MKSLTLTFALCLVACGPREVRTRVESAREHRISPGQVPETVRRAQEQGTKNLSVSPQDVVAGKNLEERTSIARTIWASPLGRLYSEYLFNHATPIENLRRVTTIVDRVFADALWTVNRVTAVQLMTEDLFNTGKVDPVINDRIGLLMMNVTLRRKALEVEAAKELGWQLPAIAVVGFLAGSPIVRKQVGLLTSATKHGAKWVVSFGSKREAMSARRAVGQLDWRGLVSSDFSAGYSPWQALLYGGAAFGTYAPIYYGVKTGSADSASPVQKTVLYNLQQLIDLSKM